MLTLSALRTVLRHALALTLVVGLAACGDAEPEVIDSDLAIVTVEDADAMTESPELDAVDPMDDMATDAPAAAPASGADGGAASAASPPAAAPGRIVSPALMMGTWESTQDDAVMVEFYDGTFTERYEGEAVASGPYTTSDGCAGTDAPVFAFTVTVDGDAMCYSVVSLSDTGLQYSLAGGRGNTLSFRRVAESAS